MAKKHPERAHASQPAGAPTPSVSAAPAASTAIEPHDAQPGPPRSAPAAPSWLWSLALPLAIYTVVVFLVFLPALGVYAWIGHEKLYAVVRVRHLCALWSAEGPFHAPWFPDICFGYGWPFFTYYAPLGYYVAAAAHFILGLGYGPATGLSFALAAWLSGAFMFLFARRLGLREGWPRAPIWALAAALMYLLAPYHMTDVFARVSLAESWAWAWLAGTFCALEWSRERERVGALALAVAYAALMLSHNISALYGSAAIAIYALATARDWRWAARAAAAGALGAAISAYYWLGALTQLKLVVASDAKAMLADPKILHGHCVQWSQFFLEHYGRGDSVLGPGDDMALNPGLLILGGGALAAAALVCGGLGREARRGLAAALGLFALALFAVSPLMPWRWTPTLMQYVQLPWRILLFSAFFGCAAMAMASPWINRWLHPAIVCALAVMMGLPPVREFLITPSPDVKTDAQLDAWYEGEERLGLYAGCYAKEYRPLTAKPEFTDPAAMGAMNRPANRLTTAGAGFEALAYEHRGTAYAWKYRAAQDSPAVAHLFFFPGWSLRIDGRRASERMGKHESGLIALNLPAGEHTAELKYGLSPAGRMAKLVSVTGWAIWIGLGGYWFYEKRKRRSSLSPS